MKRPRSGAAKKKLDRLAAIVRGLPPGRVIEALRKSESLTIRLTSGEKEEMRRAASGYGLTITEYVTRLAALERELTRRKGRRRA